MTPATDHGRSSVARELLAVTLILLLGLAAEAAHFSWRDGRPVLNGDSLQYVDAAEALLSADRAPDFALRKPGYPLILAGAALLLGNMTWGALAVNHFFLGLLPVAAYALGRSMHSRLLGCTAALFTMARLQELVYGDRIMSEAAYMCFLTFGVVALASGLSGQRSCRRMFVAGVLLAAAWLIRSVATVVVCTAFICILYAMRHRLKYAIAACLSIAVPLAGAALCECALNLKYAGQFRPSTGSFGLMLMMRTRHFQGLPMPQTETTQRCLTMLPDRDPQDAYRASEVDTWAARYRAVHDYGMDDWDVDALMTRSALESIAAHPVDFVQYSAYTFVRHLLRQREGPHYARISPHHSRPFPAHPAGAEDPDFQDKWYAYWGLPNRTLPESVELADRLRLAASGRAPFAAAEPLPTIRYVSMLPPVADMVGVLADVASLWPGFALLLCGVLRLNVRICAFLALSYLVEALLISVCCPSETAATRYQCVWLATDATCAAALVTVPIASVIHARSAEA